MSGLCRKETDTAIKNHVVWNVFIRPMY